VQNAEGKDIRIFGVDIRSPTFGEDYRRVFQKNVAEARRDNLAVAGCSDGPPKPRDDSPKA
jgi:hypothetical protein